MKYNKKVIAVPRLKKYGEHVNDHQLQLVESFSNNGYIKGVFNIEDLPETIKNIGSFIPNKYVGKTNNIIKIIENYIDNS